MSMFVLGVVWDGTEQFSSSAERWPKLRALLKPHVLQYCREVRERFQGGILNGADMIAERHRPLSWLYARLTHLCPPFQHLLSERLRLSA